LEHVILKERHSEVASNFLKEGQMSQCRASFFRYPVFGAAFLLAACATQEQIAPQATTGLTQVRTQAVQLKQQLSRTNDAARTLSTSSGSDLASSLESVSANLDALKSTLGVSRQAVRSAQDQVTAYFANWEKQSRGMSEEMQKTSKQRQAEAAASFESLRASIDAVRAGIWPYINDMSETVKYLRTDQTKNGVDAVSSRLNSTIASEPAIQRDLDSVISQIDAIMAPK
jgi:chromosome segregation ATPase